MHRLVALLPLLLVSPAQAADAWRAGPGRDRGVGEAATCHTLDYIRMNAPFLTADVWKAEVTKMRTAFGAPIDDDAAAEIVRYLGAQYGKN
jgi:hypothetical protein